MTVVPLATSPAREHRRARAHVEGARAGAVQGRGPVDDRRGAGADDLGAHLAEFVDVEHAVIEDPLVD